MAKSKSLKMVCFPSSQNASTGSDHPDGCDDSPHPSSPSDATFVSQHALRQAELGRQLQELTKALALKEELANKMVANDSRLTSMRKQYEVGETLEWFIFHTGTEHNCYS